MHPHGPHLQRTGYCVHRIVVRIPVGNHSAHDVPIRNVILILCEQLAPWLFKRPAPATKRVGVELNLYPTLLVTKRTLLMKTRTWLCLIQVYFGYAGEVNLQNEGPVLIPAR